MAVKSETAVRETTVRAIGTSGRVVVTGKAPASVRTQTVGRTMASMRMQMAAEAARRRSARAARDAVTQTHNIHAVTRLTAVAQTYKSGAPEGAPLSRLTGLPALL